jgi:hypothetical protein
MSVLERVMHLLDVDHNGTIDVDEFVSKMIKSSSVGVEEEYRLIWLRKKAHFDRYF